MERKEIIEKENAGGIELFLVLAFEPEGNLYRPAFGRGW